MTAEVIEGEVREVEHERAVVVASPNIPAAVGTFALAALDDDEFDRRLAIMEKGRDRVARIQRALMTPDVDFGTIPGTPKPTLLKPGAEKLAQAYGLAADFTPERHIGDGETAPALAYVTRCQLHLGSIDGPIVAVGYGSSNSWERKHRYRAGERVCPSCGKPGTILKSKRGAPEWFCWAKKGGCGATFPIDDKRITDQVVGDIENPDPWDLDTTLLKMAEKRAFVDATLRATAASGLFTQDVEDLHHEALGGEAPQPAPEPRSEPRQAPAPSDGPDVLHGTATAGKSAPVDLNLRQTPDGPILGFVVVGPEGKGRTQVIALGQLADAIWDAIGQDGHNLDGCVVSCEGTVERVPWQKDGKDMPPYRRMTLARIEAPAFTLPDPMPAADPAEQAAIDASLASLPW